MLADVIVGLQYGDCGKGKVTNYLLNTGYYTHCLRYSGAHNCGHTSYLDGKKIITHILPAGVFHGVTSIVGPGCCLHVEKFLKELEEADKAFPLRKVKNFIRVAYNAHIITDEHIAEDSKDVKIGTTRTGSGPAFRDKHARTGIRAKSIPELQKYLIDPYEEFHINYPQARILCEGAQGFGLDIDFGDYPMVTSSNCVAGAVTLNGIPCSAVNRVIGVAKAYMTYVGAKKFQPDGSVFDRIADLGEEYGATTGRRRQVDWMDYQMLMKAIKINGVTDLVINKMDILRRINEWKLKEINGKYWISFPNEKAFKNYIVKNMPRKAVAFGLTKRAVNVTFSDKKDKI